MIASAIGGNTYVQFLEHQVVVVGMWVKPNLPAPTINQFNAFDQYRLSALTELMSDIAYLQCDQIGFRKRTRVAYF
jgi:hypothetical protein